MPAETLTPERLAELRRIAEALPRGWSVRDDTRLKGAMRPAGGSFALVVEHPDVGTVSVAEVRSGCDEARDLVEPRDLAHGLGRTLDALPALLDEVERLRTALGVMERQAPFDTTDDLTVQFAVGLAGLEIENKRLRAGIGNVVAKARLGRQVCEGGHPRVADGFSVIADYAQGVLDGGAEARGGEPTPSAVAAMAGARREGPPGSCADLDARDRLGLPPRGREGEG